jgi:regulatory protein
MQDQNIRSGTITAIKDQIRDPERVNVFIDDVFAFGLDRTVATEHGLHVGRKLEAEDIARLLAAEETSRAIAAALQFLAYRPRSSVEVQRRLARRGFSPEATAATMARLREWRYVDDDSFARAWIENRVIHQPRGRRLIKQELREKGVAPELADAAIDEAAIDEFPAALQLAQKRVQSLAGLDPLVRRRRLGAFLQRRGYGWDVVKRVLDAITGEDSESDE